MIAQSLQGIEDKITMRLNSLERGMKKELDSLGSRLFSRLETQIKNVEAQVETVERQITVYSDQLLQTVETLGEQIGTGVIPRLKNIHENTAPTVRIAS